jgi:hypothetical protein
MYGMFFLFLGMGAMSYQPGTFGQPPNYYGSGRLEEEFSGQPLAVFRDRIRIRILLGQWIRIRIQAGQKYPL